MRLALALALAAASAPLAGCPRPSRPAPPPEPISASVVLAPPAVGSRWIDVEELSLEAELRAGTAAAWFGQVRRHRTETKILEVDAAGLVTRVAVAYLEREDRASGPGARTPAASPLAGKAYVVASAGGKLSATHRDGSRVSAAELHELTLDQGELGTRPVMDQLLARTWTAGEEVRLSADELGRLNEHRRPDELQPTAMSFTLREVRGDEVELALRTRMQMTRPVSMTVDGTGSVTVDARSGRTTRMRLLGAVNGTAGGHPFSGNMKLNVESSAATAAASR